MFSNRNITLAFTFLVLTGCATLTSFNFAQKFGVPFVRDRTVSTLKAGQVDYHTEVKSILESRCVVCHACYDAPCQLKLGSLEGIDRGATKERVYHSTRLVEAQPTRLFLDAQNTEQWREKEFFPVLNEYGDSIEANREAGLIHRMLSLKKQYPLPERKILGDDFEFGINREYACPKPEEFPEYENNKRAWGMPYALPSVSADEHRILTAWLDQGAVHTAVPELKQSYLDKIAEWESLLNGDSKKQRLSARYIYEHLFLGHIYFDELPNLEFFNLVRSSTPPGEDIKIIATRRPYDDPKVERVYYRFSKVRETIVSKTHMPYALNAEKMQLWKKLFFDRDYVVSVLPGYEPVVSANPFAVFSAIPVTSRYEFMLDEAKFTISGFIKGPVCRGQIALNVINDHFWVFFVKPIPAYDESVNEFYRENYSLLQLPAAEGSTANPVFAWRNFAKKQKKYLKRRDALFTELQGEGFKYDLSVIWDGNTNNPNAALTIFRHFDSATVEQGLLGESPKTAWVLGYTDLERIHYLLVAGYDVYGNLGHQLLSRLYMDFLRMDGESYFLFLLPQEARSKERQYWYRDANKEVLEYLSSPEFESVAEPEIDYLTDNPKEELFEKLRARLSPVLKGDRDISNSLDAIDTQLKRVHTKTGLGVSIMPEHSLIHVKAGSEDRFYTMIKNSAHLNMTSMFVEKKNRLPREDTLMVLKGFVGSYPRAFFSVDREDVRAFVNEISALKSEKHYSMLKDKFGVRRTDSEFWSFSDLIHRELKATEIFNSGVLDYNRLEDR